MTTREIIVDNATKLFMSRGVKAITMDDIANECGISKRTLYEQFRDKSELLEAFIQSLCRNNNEQVKRIIDNSNNVLEVLLKIHEMQATNAVETYDNLYQEIKKFYPEVYNRSVSQMRETQIASTEQMLRQGQKEGVFISLNTDNVPLTALAITQMIDVVKSAGVLMEPSLSKKDILLSMMIVFLRGLTTEKGRQIIDRYINSTKSENTIV